MILFTSGFPCSGKSEFVKLLIDVLNKNEYASQIIQFNPKEYLPENYDRLNSSEQTDWNVSSWETCLEMTKEALIEYDNCDLIILDTAASKVQIIRPIFGLANKYDHDVIYTFINSNFEDRQSRTHKDIGRLEESYVESFKITLPQLRKMATKFMIINNPNDDEKVDLNRAVLTIHQMIEDMHKEID